MATKHPKVDVVTIGAGWTSAILGAKLCPKGTTMVALEQGTHRWTYPDFAHDHDSLRYSVRYAMMVDLARETWTWRPTPDKPALPMRQYGSFNPGEGLGGAAIHWSAQLWRFLQYDFRHRSHIVDRYGASKLPEGSTIQDWPVGYDDLESYYDAFEWDLGASGHRRQRPRRDPSRRQPVRGAAQPRLPEPAARDESVRGHVRQRVQGARPAPVPAAGRDHLTRLHRPFGNLRSGCLYCGFCTRFGCEVDAKASPQNTHLPVALETGRYDVRLGCKVLRIETGADGLATGVTYVDGKGQEHFQPADVVVASAFTLENNRLLLLSRSQAASRRESATIAAASGGTTRTRSTRRPSSACGRARS